MPLTVAEGLKITRAWVNAQEHIPAGAVIFPRDYDPAYHVRPFDVMVHVMFDSDEGRRTFRLVSLTVDDEGQLEVEDDRVDYVFDQLLGDTSYEIVTRKGRPVQAKEISYDGNHPPESIEDALERLGELPAKEERIQAQLDNARAEGFGSPDEFQMWRNKATKALGHARSEMAYLRNWVRKKANAEGVENPLDEKAKSHDISELQRQVNTLLPVIQQAYQPIYSADTLPPDVDTALHRKMLLEQVERDITIFFNQMALQATAEGIGRKAVTRARRPLIMIDQQIRAELETVTAYLQLNVSATVATLLGIIDRVVAEGFELTEPEHAALAKVTAIYSTPAEP